jgi:predicted phage tail protein
MTAAVPLTAGALLALAELGFSFGPQAEEARAGILPRLAWAAAAGLGGTVVSALVLLAATAHVARSLGVTVAGTAAAVIVVAMLSQAWRR